MKNEKKVQYFDYETEGPAYIRDGHPLFPSELPNPTNGKVDIFVHVMADLDKGRFDKVKNRYK